MYIRSLPHSRRSKNRRRSGRWVRCAILDRKWVAPSATIGLYLLDDKRRETERAVDRDGEPVALAATSSESDLISAIRSYGAGRYRLVARNRQGHILARRDVVAAIYARDLDAATHAPRSDVERLKAELATAHEAAESARAERDAARAEAEASKQAVAERDAEITGLEQALEQQGEALRRARRLYAELGNEGGATERAVEYAAEDDTADVEETPVGRRQGHTAPRRPGASGPRQENTDDDDEPKLFGLGRAEMREIAGLVKDLFRDEPATDSNASASEPAEGEHPDGEEGAT